MDKKNIILKLDEIIPYEKNNKIHGRNVERIKASIKRNGYITPIIVDEKNVILAGHGRVLAFKEIGESEVEVLQVTGLTKKQKADFRIADNKTSELSERDFEAVLSEIEEFGLDDLKLDFEDLDFSETDDDFSLPDGEKPLIETMTFTIHRDQKEEIERALQQAKDMGDFGDTGNENSNGNAIVRVCEVFITQNT